MKTGNNMKIFGIVLVVSALGYMFVAASSHYNDSMAKCELKLSHDACFQILNR